MTCKLPVVVEFDCHPEQAFFARRRISASCALRRVLCDAIIARLARFLAKPHYYQSGSILVPDGWLLQSSAVSFQFKIESTSGSTRTGRLLTPHGDVETPVFMPVGTLASVKGISQDLLEELGVQILLGNTYHLYLRPGIAQVRKLGGVHRFMSWPRAILTDSGGFQVFSLNHLRKVSEEGVTFRSHLDGSEHFFSPERAMEAQIGLGADIIMAFDECTEYPADRERDALVDGDDSALGRTEQEVF